MTPTAEVDRAEAPPVGKEHRIVELSKESFFSRGRELTQLSQEVRDGYLGATAEVDRWETVRDLIDDSPDWRKLDAALDSLQAETQRLVKALEQAIDCLEGSCPYLHGGTDEDIARRLRAALSNPNPSTTEAE